MGMCGHQPSAPRHRSSDISAGQTEAQSKSSDKASQDSLLLVDIFLEGV